MKINPDKLVGPLAILLGELEVPEAYDPLFSFEQFFDKLSEIIKAENPEFDEQKFCADVYLS